MNCIFFGSSAYVIPIIKLLKPVLVLTTEKNETQPVIAYCENAHIPYKTVAAWDAATVDLIKQQQVPVAVLASFGKIVPEKILELFPFGILNIHPSLLPEFRGSLPIQAALLHGKKVSGVSIIRLDAEMDHGPVLAQRKVSFLPNETAGQAYPRFFAIGAEMIADTLPPYMAGKKTPIAQDHEKATFTKRHLTKADGFVTFPFPENLKEMIRAYAPWPGVWTKIKLQEKGAEKIVKVLPEGMLQVEGKKPMTYKDFLNGYPFTKPIVTSLIK